MIKRMAAEYERVTNLEAIKTWKNKIKIEYVIFIKYRC